LKDKTQVMGKWRDPPFPGSIHCLMGRSSRKKGELFPTLSSNYNDTMASSQRLRTWLWCE